MKNFFFILILLGLFSNSYSQSSKEAIQKITEGTDFTSMEDKNIKVY